MPSEAEQGTRAGQTCRGVQALAAVLLLCCGCGADVKGHVDGPLLSSVGTAEGGMAALVRGPLALEGDCLLLGGHPVVWPESTSWDSTRESVLLPNGSAAAVGASVAGGGGMLPLPTVRQVLGDEVADAAARCVGDTGEVAVFNPGGVVTLT